MSLKNVDIKSKKKLSFKTEVITHLLKPEKTEKEILIDNLINKNNNLLKLVSIFDLNIYVIKDDKKLMLEYPDYYSLTDYQKKCLIATNYWREVNGLKTIEVPTIDEYYYNYYKKKIK